MVNDPVVDLSTVTFIEPFAMIYLGMFLRHWNARGFAFTAILPERGAVARHMEAQRFWDRFNFDIGDASASAVAPRLSTRTSLDDIVDIEARSGIAEEVAQQVVEFSLVQPDLAAYVGGIAEISAELVDNFAVHSEGPLAAFTVQYYPHWKVQGADSPRIVLAIGDCGIGIRKSLSRNPVHRDLEDMPHAEAARRAFELGVTCRGEGEGGLGLVAVRDAVTALGGSLLLTTGDGFLRLGPRGPARRGRMAYDLPGVQAEIIIPCKRESD